MSVSSRMSDLDSLQDSLVFEEIIPFSSSHEECHRV